MFGVTRSLTWLNGPSSSLHSTANLISSIDSEGVGEELHRAEVRVPPKVGVAAGTARLRRVARICFHSPSPTLLGCSMAATQKVIVKT